MTNNELFTLMRNIVMLVTGVPTCILADQNTSAPAGSYATIRPRQSVKQYGQAGIKYTGIPDDKVRHTIKLQKMCDCSINFYRGSAQEYAELIAECNKRPDVQELLMRASVGWNGADAVNNLTSLQANNWEQRAQVTVRLMYEIEQIVDTNAVTNVGISTQIESGDVVQVVDVTVNS